MPSSSSLTTPLLSLSLHSIFYLTYSLLSPYFDTDRKKAYILSSISSFTMTTLSIPFFVGYLTNGLEGTFKDGQDGWMGGVGWFGAVFFGVYLFGYIKYRSQVGLLTGWIHHTVYIGLMFYIVHAGITPVFLMGAVMELPTFDLAISNLFPSVRNDLRFLSSFFIFRILFHIIYLVDCARPSSRAFMGGSWIPTVMLGLALLMHMTWFRGGVTGYIKRHSASQVKNQKKTQTEVTVEVEEDPVISMASTMDRHISSDLLPPSAPMSPDESPLVTPRTPSQIPFLSTLNIPAISLPTGIIDFTTLKENGNGFKEAVKHRWDEQKEKFVAGRSSRRRLSRNEGSEEEVVVVREVEVDE
ncbi:hypothetical protein I302_104894 [Kwoniella bestiolae CBS 10118]|uniref:TLC domain-containing protein n=1 Tax=Kwoniella bestiolae CBS 10118 TaxID=1296100 RepID=A0A1B9FRG2_9TREE|nr:hypothetical protein I302_09035 [Kwoniella bestiolae CBS 10118]OCF21359.1 hypothetical protein I302_09035 [Kwoniella bestiolae CBS 10118]